MSTLVDPSFTSLIDSDGVWAAAQSPGDDWRPRGEVVVNTSSFVCHDAARHPTAEMWYVAMCLLPYPMRSVGGAHFLEPVGEQTTYVWCQTYCKHTAALRVVPNYTAWWKRDLRVNNLPKYVMARSQTLNLLSHKPNALKTLHHPATNYTVLQNYW